MSTNIVILSGGFDPIHEGHIAMFKQAKQNYDYVVVGLNSDEWLARKKGKPFMSFETRMQILSAIRYVDLTFSFDDADGTAISLLEKCKHLFPDAKLTFGNGGDRSNSNYPEHDFCINNAISLNDSLGGSNKANSSSWILDNWKTENAMRDWGMWKVLFSYIPNTTKIKELVVAPGKSLSWQKHLKRSEVWFVREGTATAYYSNSEYENISKLILEKDGVLIIPQERWHKLSNETEKTLSIIEIQYGSDCSELDIIRATFPS
jgi:D-beta-D-heptose 7-phosphate kinase/D-beta-D-heptose 1-phosphate adenosyltransferase